jgi:hypothetical protein
VAIQFRYRYVGFGTRFELPNKDSGRERTDPPNPNGKDDANAEHVLYFNELVADVGGECHVIDNGLAVLDHHFTRTDTIEQYPSAATAVLHNARRIRDRFFDGDRPRFNTIWLVTHQTPDFDAFCSLYLARMIIEKAIPEDNAGWRKLGLHPDGWQAVRDDWRVNWYAPRVPLDPGDAARRWAMLLASYAAAVDNCRRVECRRDRALHSILYAAIRRGRPYAAGDNGAVEFFNAARDAIRDDLLNPMIDSLFEENLTFRPELRLLDGQDEAYQRDLKRARTAIVFLREAKEEFSHWFSQVERVVNQQPQTPAFRDDNKHVNAIHGEPPDGARGLPRRQADAIYLRDPECVLFKEWARADTANSSLGQGFLFTAIAYTGGRATNPINNTDYYFALDPERCGSAHLYTLWTRLQEAEMKVLEERNLLPGGLPRRDFIARGQKEPGFFKDPWFDGQNYRCTIVPTPMKGTYIAPTRSQPALRADLTDDPVVAFVQEELEYEATYLPLHDNGAAPKFEVTDEDEKSTDPPTLVAIDQPKRANSDRPFRLVTARLAPDVDLTRGQTARLIGATLWKHLGTVADLTDEPGSPLPMHVTPDWVVVWTDRAVAVAAKDSTNSTTKLFSELRARFRQMIRLSGRLTRLVQHTAAVAESNKAYAHAQRVKLGWWHVLAKNEHKQELRTQAERARMEAAAARRTCDTKHAERVKAGDCKEEGANDKEALVQSGQILLAEVAEIRHAVTTPTGAPLRGFFEASGIAQVVAGWVDTHQSSLAGEHVQNIAEIQAKLKWAEIFIITVYAVELVRHIAEAKQLGQPLDWNGLLVAAIVVPFVAWFILRPPLPAIPRGRLAVIVLGYLLLIGGYAFSRDLARLVTGGEETNTQHGHGGEGKAKATSTTPRNQPDD